MFESPQAHGPGMPHRPTLLQRLALLLLSLVLPVLMLAVTAACFFALTSMGNHDRTLVWVEGTPAQLAALEQAVVGHPVFRHGRVGHGEFERHRPASCGPDLACASFSRLHDYELPVAKATLDQLVRDSGARPCRAHAFVFNDLPSPFDPAEWGESLAMMLLMLLIPVGSVLAAYWACSAQFNLPGLRPAAAATPRGLSRALGVALLALAWVALLEFLWPLLSGNTANALRLPPFSAGVLVLAALYAPFLEELAFRGWLLPIASRAIGEPAAGVFSALSFAALHLPGGAAATLSAMGLGALLAALMLRTRSLAACILAHGSFNTIALAMPRESLFG